MNASERRVGFGFDVHPLVAERPLVIGGVQVPFPRGLAGHSDGDVLSHAIMDALLGAANLGNKGSLFPSTDPRYKDACSLTFLKTVAGLFGEQGWRIVNVDATIVAQRPVLSPYFPEMVKAVSAALSIDPSRVSVKATTTDHLGFLGREEGIAACAIALLELVL